MSNGNQSHTAGVVLAAGYSTLSDGTPKVLAELNGRSLVQSAIDAQLAAELWPVAVVVNPRDSALIRETVNAEQYGDGVRWCVQPERFGTADAVRHAIRVLGTPGTWVNRLVVSMGDFGLWSPETLRGLLRTHLEQKADRCVGMTMATVAVDYHPPVFRDYGLVIYADEGASQPNYPKMINNHWDGEAGKGARVNAGLFCFEWTWITRRLADMPVHESRDEGLPDEYYITDLVQKSYWDEWPAHELELPPERAHEALSINNDDDLRYVQKVIAKMK